MVNVSFYRHFQTACKSFEDAFYLVVLVGAFGLDVEVHACSIAETLEDMQEHLCGHFFNFISMELGIPYKPRTTSKVECYLAKTVVHRQRVAVSFNSSLVAKCLQDTLAKCKGGVLDGVMLVNMQITIGMHHEVNHSMLAYLLKHMVEETKSGRDVTLSCSVEVDAHMNVSFLGSSLYFGNSLACKKKLGYLVSCHAFLA